nr:hypothetical protein [Endozoicomonas sp.]
MKKRVLIVNITILIWVMAAEVLVINAMSKAQNQPHSLDVVEAVSTMAFVFRYFHFPLPLAIALSVLLLVVPAWLMLRLVRHCFGFIR